MALKRRYSRKPRKSMTKRRRFNISRPLRATRTLTVTRTYYQNNWTPSTVAVANYWQFLQFDIGSFPDIASYRAIFEQVKMRKIKITMRPRYTGYDGANTTDTTLPGVTNQGSNEVHVIIDPKSLVVPAGAYNSTTLNTFLSQGKVKSYTGIRPINFMIKYPCVRDDVNGTTNSKVVLAPWHDIDRTTTHYGAHVFITDANLTGNFGQSYDIFVTMTLSFRGNK